MTFVTASLALAFFLRLFSSPFFCRFSPFYFVFVVWMECRLTLRPHVATTVVPFIVIPFMRRPHLATLRAFRAVLILSASAFAAVVAFLSFLSFFIVYYSFIIIATVRFCVCAPVCAPLYASMRAPLFQLGQLQIKQNTHTHTGALTHTYSRNLLMNWQIIKYANWTWPVAVTEGQRRGTRDSWTGTSWRSDSLADRPKCAIMFMQMIDRN